MTLFPRTPLLLEKLRVGRPVRCLCSQLLWAGPGLNAILRAWGQALMSELGGKSGGMATEPATAPPGLTARKERARACVCFLKLIHWDFYSGLRSPISFAESRPFGRKQFPSSRSKFPMLCMLRACCFWVCPTHFPSPITFT